MRDKLVVLLLGLALSGVMAGCSAGGSDTGDTTGSLPGTSDPRAAISGAYEATLAAKTLRVDSTVVSGGGAEGIRMIGTAELDFEKEIARLEATITGATAIDPELDNELEIVGIYARDFVYIDMVALMGEQMASALGGKRWSKSPATDVGGLGGGMFQGGFNDPRTTLSSLRDFASDVTVVGTETVRGVETAHYKTNLSVEALLQGLSEQARADAKRGLRAVTSVPIEVWLSNDGRLRRLRMIINDPDGGATITTQEYYDFGATLDVKVPPADQVVDDPSLLGGLGGTIEG